MSIPAFGPTTFYDDALESLRGVANRSGNLGTGFVSASDYSGTDTQKVLAGIAALTSRGGGTLSIKGEMELSQKIVIPSNVRLANGLYWSEAVLRPASGYTDDVLIQAGTGAVIEDITLDLDMDAACVYGIGIWGDGTLKRSAVRRCNIKNAAGRGIWVWTGQGVWIEENEIEDCVRGIHVDTTISDGVWVHQNRVTNGVAGRMDYGILVSDGLDRTHGSIVISSNYVEGADYPTANGAQAVGIALFRSPGSIVQSNNVTRCGNPANGLGAGILLGGNSEGSMVALNNVYENDTTGIYLEYDGADVTLGTDTIRCGTVSGNHVHDNAVAGISCSYAAGGTIDNNDVYRNGADGIVTDSDYVGITNNTVFNNWQDSEADAPAQNGGRKAGIRAYGWYDILTGNRVFDTQDTPTQTIAMAVEHRGCIVSINQLRASSDPLYENGSDLTNTTANNVEVTA